MTHAARDPHGENYNSLRIAFREARACGRQLVRSLAVLLQKRHVAGTRRPTKLLEFEKSRLSQGRLGDAIGLTFQQVQKYERGANRVGSSRLFDLARVLDVPLSYFFDEMSPATSARSPGRLRGMAEQKPLPFKPDPMAKRETLELVRAYYRITDARVRKRVFELTKALAKSDAAG